MRKSASQCKEGWSEYNQNLIYIKLLTLEYKARMPKTWSRPSFTGIGIQLLITTQIRRSSSHAWEWRSRALPSVWTFPLQTVVDIQDCKLRSNCFERQEKTTWCLNQHVSCIFNKPVCFRLTWFCRKGTFLDCITWPSMSESELDKKLIKAIMRIDYMSVWVYVCYKYLCIHLSVYHLLIHHLCSYESM